MNSAANCFFGASGRNYQFTLVESFVGDTVASIQACPIVVDRMGEHRTTASFSSGAPQILTVD